MKIYKEKGYFRKGWGMHTWNVFMMLMFIVTFSYIGFITKNIFVFLLGLALIMGVKFFDGIVCYDYHKNKGVKWI